MLKNIKDLSDLIKLTPQKDLVDSYISSVLNIIKKETNLVLESSDFVIKNNTLKIKSNSNTRFIILLNLKTINQKIKDLNKDLILEL